MFRFPADEGALCRYGEPFRGGDHAVLEFMAGVGTTQDEADVRDFQKVRNSSLCDDVTVGIMGYKYYGYHY